jgi:hypothetical protein
MTWAQAKAKLVTALSSAAITSPIAQTIAKVYGEPPASIEPGNLPCIILGASSMDDEWDSGLAREMYELECFLLLRNEDAAVAVQLVEAYRDAVRDKLRLNVTLGGTAQVVNGARFGRLTSIGYANEAYPGFTFTLPIVLSGPVTFGGGS